MGRPGAARPSACVLRAARRPRPDDRALVRLLRRPRGRAVRRAWPGARPGRHVLAGPRGGRRGGLAGGHRPGPGVVRLPVVPARAARRWGRVRGAPACVRVAVRAGGAHRPVGGPARPALCRRAPILAWDLFNEPEWVTRGAGSFRPFAPIGRSGMRDFVQQGGGRRPRRIEAPGDRRPRLGVRARPGERPRTRRLPGPLVRPAGTARTAGPAGRRHARLAALAR